MRRLRHRAAVGRTTLAALLVLVVIAGATLAYLGLSLQTSASSTESASSTTSLLDQSSVSTSDAPNYTSEPGITASSSTPSLTECPTKVPTPWFGTLNASKSPVTICFQLYEFNSTSPVLLNATKILNIFGFSQAGFTFGGSANFTVVPSIDHISLGGPNSENEGTIIEYSLTARPGASGTYYMILNGWLLNPEEPEECTGGAGQLVVGNGQPNYATPGGCITTTTTGQETGIAIPGVNYDVASNTLYYRIVGVGNSTQ